MKKLLTAVVLATLALAARAQVTPNSTFPYNGVADQRADRYAFTNATVHVDARTTIEGGTLLIKGGRIEAVGKGLAIPAGTVVTDLRGKHLYPSFVDLASDYGTPEIVRGRPNFRGAPQLESGKGGAYNWNQAVHPETNAVEMFKGNPARADELRRLGFGAVLTQQADGVVRGTAALVSLADDRESQTVLRERAATGFSFSRGSSTQDYPSSLMGAVALLRQTYLDADWYARATATERNLSLEAFNQARALPAVFETTGKLDLLRADRIGKELGVAYLLRGTGDEYQRVADVKATNAPLIIPLAFPTAFDVEDPFDAQIVSLAELKHWELAPTNAAALARAAVPFALTTAGLKDRKEFTANLRKAMTFGLDEAQALEALTAAPARFVKADNLLGSLRAGAWANFLVTSGGLFKDDNVLYENWVQGKRYVINDPSVSDLRGSYALQVGDRTGLKLNLTGKPDKVEYQVVMDTTKIPVKASRSGNLLTLSFKLDKKDAGDARLSGYADGQKLQGQGETFDGKPLRWSATFAAAPEPPKRDTAQSKKPAEVGKVTYPFGAYGTETPLEAQTTLIRNATVWTNEAAGNVVTDVLLRDGKIAQVGANLPAAGATVVDGTGKHLTNGIFDEHSHIALFAVNEGSQSVTSEVRQGDVINSEDVNIYRQLAGGVTSAQLLHGSANAIGGQSAVVKLRWGVSPEAMKIAGADGFIKFALGENVKQANWGEAQTVRFPQTRMGVEQVMTDAFTRARAYERDWKAFNGLKDKRTAVPHRRDLELDALVEILNRKRFITCHSYVQSEINMLMHVADAFGFRVNTFTHILEGYKVADKMAKHGVGGSTFADWWAYKMEVKDAIPYNAALMSGVGVLTAINSDDGEMARRLNQEAAKAVKYGRVSETEAWKMVTLNPAKLMHLDGRLGSIRPGKDADVVLWSANPLSIYAKPEQTYVDGVRYFDLAQDLALRQAMRTERARLIGGMLAAKAGGAPTVKPTPKKQHLSHCEDLGNVGDKQE